MTPYAPLLSSSARIASAIAPPAAGSVPEPNSSISTRVLSSALASMSFIFMRNELYVLRSFSSDWSSPMSTMMRSKTIISEVSEVGMSIPHWNMYWSSPTVLRHTDLPPALGPEMRRMCFCSERVAVSGTISFLSFFRARSSSGCLAFLRFISPFSEIIGMPAMKSSAICAFAMMKSISPRYFADSTRSGIYGRRNSENS